MALDAPCSAIHFDKIEIHKALEKLNILKSPLKKILETSVLLKEFPYDWELEALHSVREQRKYET